MSIIKPVIVILSETKDRIITAGILHGVYPERSRMGSERSCEIQSMCLFASLPMTNRPPVILNEVKNRITRYSPRSFASLRMTGEKQLFLLSFSAV